MARSTVRRRAETAPAPRGATGADRWRDFLTVGIGSVLVGQTLVPLEGAVEEGHGLPWNMVWLVLLLLAALGAWRVRAPLIWHRSDLLAAGYFAWSIGSSWMALRDEAPRTTWNGLWQIVATAACWWLLRQQLADASVRRVMAWVLIAAGAAHAINAAHQRYVIHPEIIAQYERDPDQTLQLAGIDAPPGSPERENFRARLFSPEPLSTFALTNSLAGFLLPGLVLALGLVLRWPAQQTRNRAFWIAALVSWGAVASSAALLLLTQSRSALVGLVAGIGVLLLAAQPAWLSPRRRWMLLGAGVAGLALGLGVLAWQVDRGMIRGAARSLGYRLEYWTATCRMIAAEPLWGVGVGNFAANYPRYKLETALEEIRDPHQALLEVFVTAGIPAGVLAAAWLGWMLWRGLRSLLTPSPPLPSSPTNEASDDASGRSQAIAVKLACGCLWGGVFLAWLLGQIDGSSPQGVTCLVFVVAGPAVVWGLVCFTSWQQLESSRWLAAMVALGVNLLAAGGIGYPSVAGAFWVVALALVGATERQAPLGVSGGGQSAIGPRWPTTVWLLAGAGLLVLCWWTAFRPVMICEQGLSRAAVDPRRAWDAWQAAAAADSLSPRPWNAMAETALSQWQATGEPEAWRQFRRAAEEWLRREPRANLAWRRVGLLAYQAAERPSPIKKEALDLAVSSLRRAAELYPTDARRQAELSLALAAQGDHSAAFAAAEEARRLHRATPHAAKKLADELLDRLPRSG